MDGFARVSGVLTENCHFFVETCFIHTGFVFVSGDIYE